AHLAVAALPGALWAVGCNYFDAEAERLIKVETADAGKQGGTGGAGSTAVLTPADSCVAADKVPELAFTYADYATVDTAGLKNNIDTPACISGRTLRETDGFFKVNLTRGK